jgi:hypothetical protein
MTKKISLLIMSAVLSMTTACADQVGPADGATCAERGCNWVSVCHEDNLCTCVMEDGAKIQCVYDPASDDDDAQGSAK